MKEAGLVEMMKKMDIVTEKLTTICGKWDKLYFKLGTQDKEFEGVRAQLLSKIQELETKVHYEKTLLENQEGQMEDIHTTLDDLQTRSQTKDSPGWRLGVHLPFGFL